MNAEGCPFAGAEPVTLPIDRGMFDPPEELGRLREQTPLRRLRYTDGHVGWLVTSYELACQVLGDSRFSLYPARLDLTAKDPETSLATAVETLRSDTRLTEVFDRYVNSGKPAYEALGDADVLDVLRSPDPPASFSLLVDPPRHDQIRRIVAPYFTPRRVKEHRQLVEDIVAGRLDAMEQAGPTLDLVETFCLPIPSQVICALFGAPLAERHRFEHASDVLSDTRATAQEKVEARRAFKDFARELIRRKRTDPADDLFSGEPRDDRLSDDELVGLACAGINRHEGGDGRALRRRDSEPTAALSHALRPARGVVKRWQGYVQAGLLSRETQKTGVPTLC